MTPLVALALAVVSVQALGVAAGLIATVGGLVLLPAGTQPGAAPARAGRPDRRDVARCDRPRRRGARMTVLPLPAEFAAAEFTAGAVALLVASAIAAVAFALVLVVRWATSFPDLPAPGPETSTLGPEPPAIANLLAKPL